MSKALMFTASGAVLDIENIGSDQVKAWDIAWSLHHQNRFCGHAPVPWSVLSHTGLCYTLALADGVTDPKIKIGILLHDAAEAYVSDVNGLLKATSRMAAFCDLEAEISDTIFRRFSLDFTLDDFEVIDRYAKQALYVECLNLFPGASWKPDCTPPSKPVKLIAAQPQQFVDELRRLSYEVGVPGIDPLFAMPDTLAPYLKAPTPKPVDLNAVESLSEDDSWRI